MWTVFDLDGCLSDDRYRRHLLRAGQYADYHALLGTDQPMNRDLWDRARDRTVITTRPEQYRNSTVGWLRRHFRGDFDLLMRPAGDARGSPELKVDLLRDVASLAPEDVDVCYDDREDVVQAYLDAGYNARRLTAPSGVPEILEQMAATFRERNGIYRDNYKRIPSVVGALFPSGVSGELVMRPEWHLFELILVKLARFANAELSHVDSIHDVAVYAAMIQSILEERK